MPEGRMLKKVITTSQKLAKLKTDSARLFYTWIIPFADCEGRMRANPYILKGLIFPYLRHSPKRIVDFLKDCHNVGLITLYQNSNEQYLQIEDFHIHQTISRKKNGSPKKESKSVIPPCPKELRNNSRVNPELLQNNSAESKVKGSKSKVKGSKKEKTKIVFTNEEKLILKEFKEVKNFPTDNEEIISYIRKLKREFPTVDALRVAQEFYPYNLKNPITKKSNPFMRIRRFFINQIKWDEENSRQREAGQNTKPLTDYEKAYWKAHKKKSDELYKKYQLQIDKAQEEGNRKRYDEINKKIRLELVEWSNRYYEKYKAKKL